MRRLLVLAFALALPLCFINAQNHFSPALRQQGVTLFELTGWLLVLGFFGGIWVQLLLLTIDVILLGTGIHPQRTFWSEAIAIAVMAPILWFGFQNSWLMTATYFVIPISGGLLVKWHEFKRRAVDRRQPVTSP